MLPLLVFAQRAAAVIDSKISRVSRQTTARLFFLPADIFAQTSGLSFLPLRDAEIFARVSADTGLLLALRDCIILRRVSAEIGFFLPRLALEIFSRAAVERV